MSKRYIFKVTIAALTLAAIGIALRIYFAGSLMPNCNEGVLSSVASPDGAWTAEEVMGACGGATAVTYSEVRLRKGNDSATTVLDMDLNNTNDWSVTWKDSRHLLVSYPSNAEVYKQRSSFDGVMIQYSAIGRLDRSLISRSPH